ncbi:MAG: Rieske (2Fe-2S) protein [Actinomycetia bacterium]|nr:Rieske (2Fe-2S) protein [Actinomycetes bacterium]
MLSAGGVLASAVALGACSSAGQRASDAATRNRAASEAASEAAAAAEGAPVASTADVPVGGGIILAGAQTVITQPVEGEFKAFSSICPHQGCPVTQVRDGHIVCPCHASAFDLTTGAVLSGPAREGLSEKTVTVEGADISVS